jgi:hypothetical protein
MQGSTSWDRPDILLLSPWGQVLILECKYPILTQSTGYVSSGMAQAYFYGVQMQGYLGEISAFAVGPAGLVKRAASRDVENITVGLSSDVSLLHTIAEFVRRSIIQSSGASNQA